MGGIDAELAPTLSTFWNKGRIVALNPANRVPLLVFCSRPEMNVKPLLVWHSSYTYYWINWHKFNFLS
jgi:hypothetical protein